VTPTTDDPPGLEFASTVLSGEHWTPTPLLPATVIGSRLGCELWLKREDCTPIGSFKLRGALVAMARLGDDLPSKGVYVASAGNYGLAIAVAGQRRGVPVTVVVPEGATPSKLERICLSGGRVVVHGSDFDIAKDFARSEAANDGTAFWEDGVIEETAQGAATIGSEIASHSEPWDWVVVPLGNGSLIKGIASVIKARSPDTTIVAAVPSGTPAMALALRGESWDESAPVETIADGLAVRVPIKAIVAELMDLVDDVWLVDESSLLPAVKSLLELEQVVAEPSAAISIAGLADHRAEASGRRVAAVITGAHLSAGLVTEVAATDGLL
jgi:threonine dehydratase